MSESLRFSLEFAVIGITIVFASLALISTAIWLVRKADDGWQKHEKHAEDEALTKEQNIDMTTLILIAAATATIVQGRFYIRKVRRLIRDDAHRSTWSVQGRAVLHGSHVLAKGREKKG
ncbi:MAG: OadG family protein [Candidatus Zixiibacteriota bacterium]